MNTEVTPQPGEAPMDLVGWQLRPQRGELWTDDGQVHRLQPRVMAVCLMPSSLPVITQAATLP